VVAHSSWRPVRRSGRRDSCWGIVHVRNNYLHRHCAHDRGGLGRLLLYRHGLWDDGGGL
jgi:hypothetical protein